MQVTTVLGRDDDTRAKIISEVPAAMVSATGSDPDQIRVLIYAAASQSWGVGGRLLSDRNEAS